MLVVLDNFETHLKPAPEPAVAGGKSRYACMESVWDECLGRLAEELVGSGSRVLITCRRPLAALAGKPGHLVRLGPLPPGEAALYLRDHKALSAMFDAGGDERVLAMRLLNASRFHPLLMDRLARLAAPEYRPQLVLALNALKAKTDLSALPDLFATAASSDRDHDRELQYLDDALAASIDQLIESASPDARRLLWIIALANEPVTLGLLAGVWSGESARSEQLRQIKQMLKHPLSPPPERQEQMASELRAEIDALPPAPQRPDPGALLNQLKAVGLADGERDGPEEENPEYSCHELVRERIRLWMEQRPEDRGDFGADAIRLAYAERLQQTFGALQHENMSTALEAGARALVYCVQARAYDRLSGFASRVVTGVRNPQLLDRLIPHLEAAASSAPEGKFRWSCLTFLADALRNSGRPDKSLAFYEQAAALSRATAERGGDGSRSAWADFAAIAGNWANALGGTSNLAAAREQRLASAEAKRHAGRPEVEVVGSELEVLRIDIIQGEAEAALPEGYARLKKLQSWWECSRRGGTVTEAPDPEMLARNLISALDIMNKAHLAMKQWEPALGCLDDTVTIKRELQRPSDDIARTRVNRAGLLIRLQRFPEAKLELNACLEIFRSHPTGHAITLSTLADLYNKLGDNREAIAQERRALALRDTLPDPSERAVSNNNIANFLEPSRDVPSIAEASRRRLPRSLPYRCGTWRGLEDELAQLHLPLPSRPSRQRAACRSASRRSSRRSHLRPTRAMGARASARSRRIAGTYRLVTCRRTRVRGAAKAGAAFAMTSPSLLEDLPTQSTRRARGRWSARWNSSAVARRLAPETADAQAQALRLRALMARLDASAQTPRLRVDIPAPYGVFIEIEPGIEGLIHVLKCPGLKTLQILAK